MGFLLLQYEYQRANRQVNMLTRTGMRLNNQIARYTKRIEKMQSIFSKAQTRLENRYSQMSNVFNSNLAAAQSTGFSGFNSALNGVVIGGISLGSFIQVGPTNGVDYNTSDGKAKMLQELATAAAQAKAIMAQLISNAQEADLEKLQAQQDEQLNPIAEKEGDLQAEQSTNDALITLWQQRKEAAEGKLPDAIKGSTAKFGL